MKIGFFLYGLTGGGATRRVVTLIEGLLGHGHQVDLLVIEPRGPLFKKVKGLPLNLVPLGVPALGGWLKRRLRLRLVVPKLAAYLARNRLDVFLSGANHAHLPAVKAWQRAGRPCPLVLRLSNHITGALKVGRTWPKNWLNSLKLKTIKRLYPRADFWIGVCESILKDALALMPFPAERTAVIYNPLELEEIRQKAKEVPPHPWFQAKEVPLILGAGRLSPQKDFATLIRAFSLLRQKREARLVILGKGKQRRALWRLVKKLGLENCVSLPGFFENPWSFMARADVFVLSSRYEGLPGVLLEALAVGCPVVSTACFGGCAEVLANGRYGRLVPVGDYQALSEAILDTLDDPPPASFLQKRAEDFKVEKVVLDYLKVFESLVYGN